MHGSAPSRDADQRRPAIGAAAPELGLRNQHAETVELADLAAAPTVVMFYPFAFSRVCSAELAEVHRRWPEFQQVGARLLAISCDPMHTLRAFAEHLAGQSSAADGEEPGAEWAAPAADGVALAGDGGSPAADGGGPDLLHGPDLLSDFWPHGAAARRYGVFNPVTGTAQRASFIVDAQLRIRAEIVSDDGQARSLDAALELLDGL